MTNIIVEVSKYIMIFLIAFYAYECFAVFRSRIDAEKREWIFHRQMMLMYLIHLDAYLAIFAVTDNLAIAAIDCLKDKGLNIPKDVAVVSIGDTRISQVVSPKLTTIHYHYKTSGRKSAEIMLELLKSSIKTSKTIKKNIKLSYILIERNSA